MWLVLACVVVPARARAYSNFNDYMRAIEDGGGGGRLFSGTPADPFTCDVCHRGAQGAELSVSGLPLDGYLSGETYEITLAWPETTPNIALMAEFTDRFGQPAGATGLPSYTVWDEGQFCKESQFPAADVCGTGGSEPFCCREIDPMRDACSLTGERSLFWVPDCDTRFARMLWTAPDASAGDVWFGAGMVTSDVNADALGDGVTLVRRRLRSAGSSGARNAAVGSIAGCRVVQVGASGERSTIWAVLLAWLVWRIPRRGDARRVTSKQGKRRYGAKHGCWRTAAVGGGVHKRRRG